MLAVRESVQLLQKRDRVEVFTAAVLIRDPLPFLARVIEIQHRCNGIDAQAVDVILVQPEERVRQEKVADLVSPVVENQRAPVLVFALSWIGMLEKRSAVESGEAVLIPRKMTQHPVENHAEPCQMARVDEQLELLRWSVTARRREEAQHLIAPCSGERMLHDGHQLDMG